MSRVEDNALGMPAEVFNNPKYTETREEMYARAKRDNLAVVLPAADELFIDVDSDKAFELLENQVEMARHFMEIVDIGVTPSKSGLPHRHVIVKLVRDVTELERITLQAIFGSDRRCELLRYMRLQAGEPHPTLFLEKQ